MSEQNNSSFGNRKIWIGAGIAAAAVIVAVSTGVLPAERERHGRHDRAGAAVPGARSPRLPTSSSAVRRQRQVGAGESGGAGRSCGQRGRQRGARRAPNASDGARCERGDSAAERRGRSRPERQLTARPERSERPRPERQRRCRRMQRRCRQNAARCRQAPLTARRENAAERRSAANASDDRGRRTQRRCAPERGDGAAANAASNGTRQSAANGAAERAQNAAAQRTRRTPRRKQRGEQPRTPRTRLRTPRTAAERREQCGARTPRAAPRNSSAVQRAVNQTRRSNQHSDRRPQRRRFSFWGRPPMLRRLADRGRGPACACRASCACCWRCCRWRPLPTKAPLGMSYVETQGPQAHLLRSSSTTSCRTRCARSPTRSRGSAGRSAGCRPSRRSILLKDFADYGNAHRRRRAAQPARLRHRAASPTRSRRIRPASACTR